MTDPDDLLTVLAWIDAGQGAPPFEQIKTFALVAELEDRGWIDVHGDITPEGRAALARGTQRSEP